jgi:hypothetical protein
MTKFQADVRAALQTLDATNRARLAAGLKPLGAR